jgi:hypothetical protein
MGMIVDKSSPKMSTNDPFSSNNSSKYATSMAMTSKKNSQFVKPQLDFKDKIDNSHLPFISKIRHKPNAMKMLPPSFEKLKDSSNINEALFENNLEL